jgi:hypothetical protein
MARRGATSRGSFEATEKVAAGDVLGADCPVRALGYNGGTFYFADRMGQMRPLRAKDMTINELLALFGGDAGWLERECAPETTRKKKQDNATWHNPSAVGRLIRACRRAGVFDPAEQLRGPGLWPIEDITDLGTSFGAEQIILHAGDQIGVALYDAGGLQSIDWENAGGKVGSYVYMSKRPRARPADEAASEDDVAAVRDFLGNWNYVEPKLGHFLTLGIIGLSMVPALVPYRSGAIIQGSTGCGKSALMQFMNRSAMRMAAFYDDSTWAKLGDNFREHREAKAVFLNEAERSQDNRRLAAQITMATLTYTRGEGRFGRSGKDDVDVQANFVFGAISPPPLRPQDANRLAVIRLKPVDKTKASPSFEADLVELGDRIGPLLLRRLLEHWPRFEILFTIFRKGLLDRKHAFRSADTYGTLLAMAHLLSFDAEPVSDDVDAWCDELDVERMAIRDNRRAAHEQCLMRLMTFHVPGESKSSPDKTLGEHIVLAIETHNSELLRVIQRWGISIVKRRDKDGERKRWVAVSNSHEGLEKIFRGTAWADAGWMDSLRETPGAIVPAGPVYFAGGYDRATLLPLECFPKAPDAVRMAQEQDMDADDSGGKDV